MGSKTSNSVSTTQNLDSNLKKKHRNNVLCSKFSIQGGNKSIKTPIAYMTENVRDSLKKINELRLLDFWVVRNVENIINNFVNRPQKEIIMGLTSCGKSTYHNLQMGEEILVHGEAAVTFCNFYLKYGKENKCVVYLKDGNVDPIIFNIKKEMDLKTFTKECFTFYTRFKDEKAVKRFEYHLNLPKLWGKIKTDTPGFESKHFINDEWWTDERIKEIGEHDVIIYVVTSCKQRTEVCFDDVQMLKKLAEKIPSFLTKLIILLGRIDETPRQYGYRNEWDYIGNSMYEMKEMTKEEKLDRHVVIEEKIHALKKEISEKIFKGFDKERIIPFSKFYYLNKNNKDKKYRGIQTFCSDYYAKMGKINLRILKEKISQITYENQMKKIFKKIFKSFNSKIVENVTFYQRFVDNEKDVMSKVSEKVFKYSDFQRGLFEMKILRKVFRSCLQVSIKEITEEKLVEILKVRKHTLCDENLLKFTEAIPDTMKRHFYCEDVMKHRFENCIERNSLVLVKNSVENFNKILPNKLFEIFEEVMKDCKNFVALNRTDLKDIATELLDVLLESFSFKHVESFFKKFKKKDRSHHAEFYQEMREKLKKYTMPKTDGLSYISNARHSFGSQLANQNTSSFLEAFFEAGNSLLFTNRRKKIFERKIGEVDYRMKWQEREIEKLFSDFDVKKYVKNLREAVSNMFLNEKLNSEIEFYYDYKIEELNSCHKNIKTFSNYLSKLMEEKLKLLTLEYELFYCNSFKICEPIHISDFSVVETAIMLNSSGEEVEVTRKEIRYRNQKERMEALQEIHNVSSFYHPNLIKAITCYEDKEGGIFFFSKKEDSDLGEEFMKEKLDIKSVLKILIQIARGMKYLHEKKIFHRDLKPENIFISKSGDVKIADFGLTKPMIVSEGTVNKRIIGTPGYIDPKILYTDYKNSLKSDVFSFGIIMADLWQKKRMGVFSFYDVIQQFQLKVESIKCKVKKPVKKITIEAGEKLKIDDKIRKEMYDSYLSLIEKCVSLEIEKRISFEEVIMELEKMCDLCGLKLKGSNEKKLKESSKKPEKKVKKKVVDNKLKDKKDERSEREEIITIEEKKPSR